MEPTKIQYLRITKKQRGIILVGAIVALADGSIGISRFHKEDRKNAEKKVREIKKTIKEYKEANKTSAPPPGVIVPPVFDKKEAVRLAAKNANAEKINLSAYPEPLRQQIYRFVRAVGASQFAAERFTPKKA